MQLEQLLQAEQLAQLLQLEQLLQQQSQLLHPEFKLPFVLLLNNRIKSISHQLLLQVLLFKNKIIKKKKSNDELSKVFPEEQSFVKQLLHSIKRTSFNF